MKYEEIKYQLDNSVAMKLLRSRNAALTLSFLYEQFKKNQQVSILQIDLEMKLVEHLDFLQEYHEEEHFRTSKEYLNDWCNSGLLRKTFDRGDEALFTLTSEAEKVILWIEDLQKPDEFIGTESRFLQIFELLKQIQDRSTTDVETRIAQLEKERDLLQQEIDRIRKTGEVESYSQTQIQEIFIFADRLTRQLIADFREIEQNFKNLARTVQGAQLEKDTRKGTVLGRVLDADRALMESDQGRSFNAFWKFLNSETRRQDLKSMIHNVYQLEELQPLTQEYSLLRRIERSLLNAGEYIVNSNSRLTKKLRQLLDERNIQENKQVVELIVDVQRLARQMVDAHPLDADFWILEGDVDIRLPLERPLHSLEESEVPTFSLDFTDLQSIVPEAEIAELYQQFYVDEDLLVDRIARMLEQRSSISLTDLIQIYPVTQGLPEIVAYLTIATQDDRHSIDNSIIELVTIPSLVPQTDLNLRLPQIIFRRSSLQ